MYLPVLPGHKGCEDNYIVNNTGEDRVKSKRVTTMIDRTTYFSNDSTIKTEFAFLLKGIHVIHSKK